MTVKRAKTLARLPQEKTPMTSKEIILSSIPPQKGKGVVMDGSPLGQGGADNLMLETLEEEQMEEDDVEEYVPLSQ